ncbi:MAG: hypothetical protein K2X52_13325 [Mycobacteriaceae bacterium]|nr:hypothetical protein [Mycobacteriaceae bacterium]
MKATRARAARRLRLAVVIAVAALAVVLGTKTGLPHADASEFHGPHALQASSMADHASFPADSAPPATIDHSHMTPDPECHSSSSDALISAAVPRPGADRIALAITAMAIVVAIVVAGWIALGVTRGPPGALAGFSAGRSVLTRFCIARR